MRQWDPERVVDLDRARALIGAQFAELAEAEVRPLAAGWDNTVFLVDDRWAFRFPRREIAIPLNAREIEVLPRLAPNLPLAVPEPRWIGDPTDAFPWPWFGAAFLRGEELAAAELPDEGRTEAARSVGTFLRALHEPRLRSRIGFTLPVDPNRRADMPFRVVATRRRLDELADAGTWQAPPEIDALLDDAAGLPHSSRMVLLHGDLHPRHVIVDGRRVSGIIDWGDVCIGDPSIDLSVAFGTFAGTAREALLEAYGRRPDGLTELRARVIAVFLAAALLSYADDVGNHPLRAEAARALERAVS